MELDHSLEIPVGSRLSRPKGLVTHHGIYLGNGLVFENTWRWGERIAPFATFAGNRPVRVGKVLRVPVGEIYRRVKISLGRPYNLITNNCDHTVSRIETGRGSSRQVADFALLALFAAIMAIAAADA